MTGETMKVYVGKDRIGELTTDHPASSYGIPVLLFNDQAFGPSDDRDFLLVQPVNEHVHGALIPESVIGGFPAYEPNRMLRAWKQACMRARGIDC
jgi:hypothetical protein